MIDSADSIYYRGKFDKLKNTFENCLNTFENCLSIYSEPNKFTEKEPISIFALSTSDTFKIEKAKFEDCLLLYSEFNEFPEKEIISMYEILGNTYFALSNPDTIKAEKAIMNILNIQRDYTPPDSLATWGREEYRKLYIKIKEKKLNIKTDKTSTSTSGIKKAGFYGAAVIGTGAIIYTIIKLIDKPATEDPGKFPLPIGRPPTD